MVEEGDGPGGPPARRLLLGVDLAATVVFALEGALVAVDYDLDVLGVLVIAFVTALAGGIIRDLLIGAVPPAAITQQAYVVAALLAGTTGFLLHEAVADVPAWLVTGLDAAGLSLFAVAGAEKALLHGMSPLVSVLLGGVTAVGGGTVRDLLLGRVPLVLRVDVYAVPALLGATVVVLGVRRGLPRGPTMVAGGIACFTLRVLAAWQDWNLPTA